MKKYLSLFAALGAIELVNRVSAQSATPSSPSTSPPLTAPFSSTCLLMRRELLPKMDLPQLCVHTSTVRAQCTSTHEIVEKKTSEGILGPCPNGAK